MYQRYQEAVFFDLEKQLVGWFFRCSFCWMFDEHFFGGKVYSLTI